jgi:hypothetical protein
VQQVQTQIVTFAELFVQEAVAQATTTPAADGKDKKKAKDDIVITDTQCKP